MNVPTGGQQAQRLLASVLRYDHKLLSYKIALIRALNDTVLAFPDVDAGTEGVAVPLRILAEWWVAYYWPFADDRTPIYQGPRQFRDGALRQDIAFRAAMENLRQSWRRTVISVRPSDGFFLVKEMRLARRSRSISHEVAQTFYAVVAQIAAVIGKNPVRYAGQGEWQVFQRPVTYSRTPSAAVVPGTKPEDVCVLVPSDLWHTLGGLSLWVDALCIHQWCLFLEGVDQGDGRRVDRGDIYRLLTDHPEDRHPLTWERNQVDLLMMEVAGFTCPWTGQSLSEPGKYDLEHVIPIAVYPVNELWNLVPADRRYNQNVKRDRLPTDDLLRRAQPALTGTYASYLTSRGLEPAIRADSQARFVRLDTRRPDFPAALAASVSAFVAHIRDVRGVPMFGPAA